MKKPMNFSNIKSKNFAVLEQACERYAVMAYETIVGRLAIGLKSIKYSYNQDPNDHNKGLFYAKYTPWEHDESLKEVSLRWSVLPSTDGEQWHLWDGLVFIVDKPDPLRVLWSPDGLGMVIELKNGNYIGSATSKHCRTFSSNVKV